jgi:hypothetical protein
MFGMYLFQLEIFTLMGYFQILRITGFLDFVHRLEF